MSLIKICLTCFFNPEKNPIQTRNTLNKYERNNHFEF